MILMVLYLATDPWKQIGDCHLILNQLKLPTRYAWQSFLRITDSSAGNERRVLGLWLIPNTLNIRMHYEFDSNDVYRTPAFDTKVYLD